MKGRLIRILIAEVVTVTALVGCSGREMRHADVNSVSEDKERTQESEITIRLFSNLPDREIGQGLVEQMIIDDYMEENPYVDIEVEALDDEAYKTKFKAYSMEGLPDVVMIWGGPSFLSEILEAGLLAELQEEDYAEYGFIEGTLEGFKRDGKLYGLPRNTDIEGFYYNLKMFQDNGWEVPETYDQLLELAGKIRAKGIIPVAMDGRDGWPLTDYLSDVLYKMLGEDYKETVKNAVEKGDFSDPSFASAVRLVREADHAGLFQDGYDSQDYGMAMSLFTSGQAAMFYMGSWEASMALNEAIPEEIRTNIRVFTMPRIEGGKAKDTDFTICNGGGYAVSADSKVKDEAIKFLNYMFRPDKLAKYGWENGVGLAAQDQSMYITGNETEVQLQYMDILNRATGMSGSLISSYGLSAYKSCIETEIQSVVNGTVEIGTFWKTVENACK